MDSPYNVRSPAEGGAGGDRRSIVPLMVALLSACLAFQLNASMLSPALVTMERELGATGSQVAATQTAFFTSAALFALFLPRLGDLIGRRRVLVGMLLTMAVGCVIAALATNVTVLFVGRLLQGASGPVVPMCLIMLRVAVSEPRAYGTLMGVVTAVNGGIAGVDALLGGYLATNHGFASIFWVMAATAIGSALCVGILAPESMADDRPRMDWAGSLLLAVSVGSLLVAGDELGNLGAANFVMVAVLLVVTVVAFAGFWRTESTIRHPLVSIPQLKERATWALVTTSLLTLTGIFGIMNGLVPAIAQDGALGLGMTAEQASWWILMPYAIAGLLMGPIGGRLAATLGYRAMLQVGLGGTIVVIVLFAMNVGTGSWALFLVLSIAAGITYAGIANIMLNGLGVTLSPRGSLGSLPGLNTGGINLGAGVSFAVIYPVQAAFAATGGGAAAGYVAGLIAGAIVLVGALLMSLLIPRPAGAEVRR